MARALNSFLIMGQRVNLAGELGFEPRFSESESDVLPLNYSPADRRRLYSTVNLAGGSHMGQFRLFDKSIERQPIKQSARASSRPSR